MNSTKDMFTVPYEDMLPLYGPIRQHGKLFFGVDGGGAPPSVHGTFGLLGTKDTPRDVARYLLADPDSHGVVVPWEDGRSSVITLDHCSIPSMCGGKMYILNHRAIDPVKLKYQYRYMLHAPSFYCIQRCIDGSPDAPTLATKASTELTRDGILVIMIAHDDPFLRAVGREIVAVQSEHMDNRKAASTYTYQSHVPDKGPIIYMQHGGKLRPSARTARSLVDDTARVFTSAKRLSAHMRAKAVRTKPYNAYLVPCEGSYAEGPDESRKIATYSAYWQLRLSPGNARTGWISRIKRETWSKGPRTSCELVVQFALRNKKPHLITSNTFHPRNGGRRTFAHITTIQHFKEYLEKKYPVRIMFPDMVATNPNENGHIIDSVLVVPLEEAA